jgi:hypothetical protein
MSSAWSNHATHREQASMMGRYIVWRSNHAYDERLRRIVSRADEIVAVTIGSRSVQIAAQVCCLP